MKFKNPLEDTSTWHTKNELLFSYTQGDSEQFHHWGHMFRPGPQSVHHRGRCRENTKIPVRLRTSKIQPILLFSSFCKATSGFTQFLNQLGVTVETTTTA